MSRPFVALLSLLMILATTSQADDRGPRQLTSREAVHHGAVIGSAKAGGDTINLMAPHNDPTNGPGEPFYFGDFEDAGGSEAWNGWTSVDYTVEDDSYWQVSNFQQDDPTNLAAWCGNINFPSCDDSLDPDGGYGNNWYQMLVFRYTVPDPFKSTTLTLTGVIQMDTEPAYDFVYVSTPVPGENYFDNLAMYDGITTVDLNLSTTILPPEYIDGTDVELYIRFVSDGGWSDEDCMWPTAGALQADDLNVHILNGSNDFDVFTDFQDSTFGAWAPTFPTGVGDFSKIWTGLLDVAPCRDNFTPQVAFIDDGEVVPGTGGTPCLTWCYGPQGYIVNHTGGLAGPTMHLNNAVQSPVMDWPAGDFDGALLEAEVYRHMSLLADDPGIFYYWGIRSADTDGSAGNGVQDIEDQSWKDRGFVYYGGPDYTTLGGDVSDLMEPGRDVVQLQFGVMEIGWIWGYTGANGTPAPYYDNVRLKVFPHEGPAITAREIDLAQDNFPERGSIDFTDLGSHHVRFDMAQNISLHTHNRNDPGDSLVINVTALRAGASLWGSPTLHYFLKKNPVFDAHRTAGMPVRGSVIGYPYQTAIPGPRYFFDLPDTGFLYPGDVLHYYFEATDAIGGADLKTTIMPADTTGFSDGFADPLDYASAFTVRALPTIRDNGFDELETPPILFWNDFANRGGEDEWYTALGTNGFRYGIDYDVYYTNGPTSGVGNGLGGRALSPLNLQHYTELLYSSGDLSSNTITPLEYYDDAGDDIGVVRGWLELGGKDMFLTGDNLVYDLMSNGSPDGQSFVEDLVGVTFHSGLIQTYIHNQSTPLVRAMPGNPVFQYTSEWLAYGGCPSINTFDAVEATGTAQRLAEWIDPQGFRGAYVYSAATLKVPSSAPDSRVVSLPYDLMYVYDNPGSSQGPPATRTRLLRDVLSYFGQSIIIDPGPVPTPLQFSAHHFPNPFNPRTSIFVTIPQAAELEVNVYDIRGQRVRSLYEGPAEAGQHTLMWDGTSDSGLAVSSGVYFFHVRAGDDVQVGKMALVK